VETATGRVTFFVGVLVLGAAVWAFTTSPGWSLLALAAGLVAWEGARRTRHGGRLRFVPVRTRRPVKGTGPSRQGHVPARQRGVGRTLQPGPRRPLWNRPSAYSLGPTRRTPPRPRASGR